MFNVDFAFGIFNEVSAEWQFHIMLLIWFTFVFTFSIFGFSIVFDIFKGFFQYKVFIEWAIEMAVMSEFITHLNKLLSNVDGTS